MTSERKIAPAPGVRPNAAFSKWLFDYGPSEYSAYQLQGPTSRKRLTYDEWASSEHALGPFLFRTVLDVWDEPTSSDEELDQSVKPGASLQSGRQPRDSVATNENPLSHGVNASTPAAVKSAGVPESSTKKQKKNNKTLPSEPIKSPADIAQTQAPLSATKEAGEVAPVKRKRGRPRGKTKHYERSPSTGPEDIAQPASVAAANTPAPTAAGATASPDAPGASPAARPGLRNRTPAQIHPYIHILKPLEDPEDELVKGKNGNYEQIPAVKSPSIVNSPVLPTDTIAKDTKNDEENPDKPKARPWKNPEEVEDTDFSAPKPRKKMGRPRKYRPPPPPPKVIEPDEHSGIFALYKAALEIPEAAILQSPRPAEPVQPAQPTQFPQSAQPAIPSPFAQIAQPPKPYQSPYQPAYQSSYQSPYPPTQPTQPTPSAQPAQLATSAETAQLAQSAPSDVPSAQRKPRKSDYSEVFVMSASDNEDAQQVDGSNDVVMSEAPASPAQGRAVRRPRKSFKSPEFIGDDSDEGAGNQENGAEDEVPSKPTEQTPRSKRRVRKPRHLSTEYVQTDSDEEEEMEDVQPMKSLEPIDVTNGRGEDEGGEEGPENEAFSDYMNEETQKKREIEQRQRELRENSKAENYSDEELPVNHKKSTSRQKGKKGRKSASQQTVESHGEGEVQPVSNTPTRKGRKKH